MNYIVYVIYSEQSGKRYIGHTKDLQKRLEQHNTGISKWTSGKGQWKVIYYEAGYRRRSEALVREKQLKRMKGGIQFKALLKSDNS